MRVTYRNTFLDLVRFHIHHVLRMWVFWLVHGLLFGLLLWSIWNDLGERESTVAKVLATILAASILMVFALAFESIVLLLTHGIRKNRGLLTDHEVTLTEDGVTEATAFGSTFTTWKGIVEIRSTRRYLLLYVAQHAAHVIPKAAFEDSSSCQAFLEFARAHTSLEDQATKPLISP